MVVAFSRHQRPSCHIPGVVVCAALALLAALACAPTSGWQHTDRRACAADSPPQLCLDADAEGLHELRVGSRVVLPGECIEGPADGRGGRLRTELWVSGQLVSRPRVPVRAGARTDVRVDGDELLVQERRRCDDRVDSP